MATVERRYAQALIEASKSKEEMTELNNNLLEVAEMFTSNSQFKKILLDPRIEAKVKTGIVSEIFEENNNQLFISFISLLIDKKRIGYLSGISNEYSELARKINNELLIKIISAQDLDENEINGITDKYKRLYHVDRIKYSLYIDENLLGGVKVIVGNKVYDGSLKTQLSNML